VLDKGKAAAVTTIVETRDKKSGKLIFENQSTVFIRGSGGFGGKRQGKGKQHTYWYCVKLYLHVISDRGTATAVNAIPKRAPDATVEEKTTESQAALYRCVSVY